MKINGKITLLCEGDSVKLELHDDDSSITFVRVELTTKQFTQALGRLAHTPCKSMEVRGLERVGTKMENKEFIFEVPEELPYERAERNKILIPILYKIIPESWIADMGFNSQNSFFMNKGKNFASTTIRRWVKIPLPEKE